MGDDGPPLHRRREQDGRAGTSLASWLGLGLELALVYLLAWTPYVPACLRACLLTCLLTHHYRAGDLERGHEVQVYGEEEGGEQSVRQSW